MHSSPNVPFTQLQWGWSPWIELILTQLRWAKLGLIQNLQALETHVLESDCALYFSNNEHSYQWLYPIPENWSDTFGNTTFTKSVFPFIFFIFCTLSQNKPGRQNVLYLFVVLGRHILRKIFNSIEEITIIFVPFPSVQCIDRLRLPSINDLFYVAEHQHHQTIAYTSSNITNQGWSIQIINMIKVNFPLKSEFLKLTETSLFSLFHANQNTINNKQC